MLEHSAILLLYIAFLAFAAKRLMTYMHILQQDDYDNGRLSQWIFKNKVIDTRVSGALLLFGGLWFFVPEFLISFLIFICFALTGYSEKDPRKRSKKKLVLTARARRIFVPAYLILMTMGAFCFFYAQPWTWIPVVQAIPFILILSNMILQPFEDSAQKKFWNEAHNRILELSPKTIAITGSYGKTSVKHILGHILKSQAPTLITPGSVNTPMGITRIIREELDESHKYFIVEMGAYGPGSIERLCKLTPPDMGIITSIGHAHFERFKTLDAVAETKFELAAAVLNKDEGKVIVHERTLRFAFPRDMKFASGGRFTVCGEPANIDPEKRNDKSYLEEDDLHILKVNQTSNGIHVSLTWKDKLYTLEAPLFGAHHGHNLALAFAAAIELGLSAEDIRTSLRSLSQIQHRLEVKKQPDGSTIIDDAFNSNPVGFGAALDLLTILKKDGRAILITPGMVELGAAHEQAHKTIGEQAGRICDVAVVVMPKRIPSFVTGFKSTGESKTLIEVESFAKAAEWLADNKREGDVVLLENDLPDIYEHIPKI